MRVAPLIALIGTGTLAGCAAPRAINLTPMGQGTVEAPCVAELDGERIPVEALPARARRWRGREVHLRVKPDVPFRCFGSIIFQLQRSGLRIGFISEPAATEPSQ